ncbi:hypothetical protein E2542_SST13526 [Spatholobus suberectus]|nr:hypothetical protein E2542_SST13526 [Spatholobus suberectus]
MNRGHAVLVLCGGVGSVVAGGGKARVLASWLRFRRRCRGCDSDARTVVPVTAAWSMGGREMGREGMSERKGMRWFPATNDDALSSTLDGGPLT